MGMDQKLWIRCRYAISELPEMVGFVWLDRPFFGRVIILKSQEETWLAALGTLPEISFDSAVDFTYRDFVLFFSYGIG